MEMIGKIKSIVTLKALQQSREAPYELDGKEYYKPEI